MKKLSFFGGEPLRLSPALAYRLAEEKFISYDWDCIPSEEELIGERTEIAVSSLATLLNCKVSLSKRGSVMDCVLKADLMLEYHEQVFIWQLKSSLGGAKAHLSKEEPVYKGQRYSLPGVIVFEDDDESQKWDINSLKALSSNCSIPVRKSVVEAYKLHKSTKNRFLEKGLPARLPLHSAKIMELFSKEVVSILTLMGYCRVESGKNPKDKTLVLI
ncbi:hypothetical protein V6O07_00405 [Arthrospira platensis SPKY2]